jgi:hypothetical protein
MYHRQDVEEETLAYQGTKDMSAFIRALVSSTSDIGADITPDTPPRKDIWGNIRGWTREKEKDLTAETYGIRSESTNIYASILGYISTHTVPIEYEETIVATPLGISIIRRSLTKLPDLTASIHGWVYTDLGAYIEPRQIYWSDLRASIMNITQVAEDINANITSTYTKDITGILTTIPYVVLNGILVTIPYKDLPTTVMPVPPKDMYAFGGGHYPKDLGASLEVKQPIPLYALIRAGDTSVSDVTANITSSGAWSIIEAHVKALTAASLDLPVNIICRIPVDFRAYLTGWATLGISASIVGVYSSDIGGWITPWYRENEKDMVSFVRASWGGVSDIPTHIYGWISTHTSDKPTNFYLLRRFPNRFLIGQPKGLSVLKIEIVWGDFPDLHASIIGDPFYVKDLLAYILPTTRPNVDLDADIKAVTQTIHITKIPLNIVNLSDLSVYISAFSGYLPMSANIRGVAEVHTTTAANSGWVYTSSSVRFYLGTNLGLAIPPRRESAIRPSLFINTSPIPDLWAYIFGWEVFDIGASISVQPYIVITGSIIAQDTTHLSSITAYITSTYTRDIAATITGLGSYASISADISSAGGALDLAATIKPYLKILGFRLIAIETQPFLDLRAILNPIFSCGGESTYSNISAFIRACSSSSSLGNLYASIYPTTDRLDISASITGRLLTKIKLISFSFRTKTRLSSVITSLITGVGLGTNNLTASIKGIPHEFDISASITAVRYRLSTMDPIGLIPVYKENGQLVTLYKELLLSFSSQVSEYVYDTIDSAVYEIGDGRWVLNLEEFTDVDGFYDRNENDRNKYIDGITEYDSVDEAIREAIRILTEMYRSDITASIVSVGGYLGLKAEIEGLYADRVSDLPASLMVVSNIPDLYASISAFSGYRPFSAYIIGYASESLDLNTSIYGVVYTSIGASIQGIT